MKSQDISTRGYHHESPSCHGHCAPQEQRSNELSHTAASLRFRTKQPRDEKDRPQAHYVSQPKGYQHRMREPGHMQLRPSSRLDGNCQVSRTPQGQCRQRTEPYIGKPNAQNQVKPGMRKTRHRHTMSHNPRVLMQDEVVRPHASAATLQARWQLSHTAASLRLRSKWTQG